MTSLVMGSLVSFMYATKSAMPPSYWNWTRLPSPRSSVSVIRSPAVRNAVSRRRCSSVPKSYSTVSKMSASGWNVIVVPVSLVASPLAIGPCGAPRT